MKQISKAVFALLLGLSSILVRSRVNAQVNSDAFSPSVTSFKGTDGHSYVVTAYAYSSNGGGSRMVGIQRSTDAGQSWMTYNNSPFTFNPPIGGSTADNIDDPQVLSIGGDNLILVVRAWKHYGSTDYGATWGDMSYTIPTTCGIFLALSTNDGANWGYYNNGTWTEGKWMTIGTSASDGSINTVEYPRIAYRKGFNDNGYIVWEKKSWVSEASVTLTNLGGQAGSDGKSSHTAAFTNAPGLWTSSSSVSVACFNVAGTDAPVGWVRKDGSGTVITKPFANSGSLANNHFSPGPESPSVAIAPDGEIWIAFQRICYAGYDEYYDQNQTGFWTPDPNGAGVMSWFVNGRSQPDAFIYVTEGTFDPAAGFTFETEQQLYRDEIVGYYNCSRGYLYDKDATSSHNAMWDGAITGGPSIQVACLDPRECCPMYSVGLVDVFTTGGVQGQVIDTLVADPRSWLMFFHADVCQNGKAADFASAAINNIKLQTSGHLPDYGNTQSSDCPSGCIAEADWRVEPDGSHAQDGVTGLLNFRFFPTLKYVEFSDGFDNLYPEQPQGRNESFFLLAWMSAGQYLSPHGSNSLDSIICRVAVSFDNQSFTLTNSSGKHYEIQDAENYITGSYSAVHWGTKLDVCADGGDLKIHAVWHSAVDQNTTKIGLLKAERGGVILVRPQVNNFEPMDQQKAFPNTPWFATMNSVNYNPLVDFEMQTMPSLPTSGSITYASSLGLASLQTSPSPPTAFTSPGIYDIPYHQTPIDYDIGDLGTSNQRRLIMTGNTVHCFGYQSAANGSVWHSHRITKPDGSMTDWSQPECLTASATVSNWKHGTPASAVYMRGGNSKQKAFAVVWRALTDKNNPAFVFYTKEMDGCDSRSGGALFRIIAPLPTAAFKSCTPAIAPLTVPVTPGKNERYLLGWVITYPSNGILYHITFLRGDQKTSGVQALTNDQWGQRYSQFTLAKNQSDGNLMVVWNDIGYWPYTCPRLTADGFVSITSNENNRDELLSQSAADPHALAANSHEIAFTNNGNISGLAAYAVDAQFYTSGDMLGTLQPVLPPVTVGYCQGDGGYYDFSGSFYARNPSITINSSGQNLLSAEHMNDLFAYPQRTRHRYSWIRLSNTTPPLSTTLPPIRTKWSTIVDNITESVATGNEVTNASYSWLLNPSLTSYPKTRLANADYDRFSDYDPSAAELLFWKKDSTYWTGSKLHPTLNTAPVNTLHGYVFWEQNRGFPWTGQWYTIPQFGLSAEFGKSATNPTAPIFPVVGTNAHRSFGLYNNGPKYLNDPKYQFLYPDKNYAGFESYAGGNDVSSALHLITPDPGTWAGYKMGTFVQPTNVEYYRSESRVAGNSMVTFKWGKVYVEDTALGLPPLQIILHNGQPDSAGFASTRAMRDSIFATEWFNWPVSASINYDRLLFVPVGGHLDSTITLDSAITDSVSIPDSLKALIAFDTIVGSGDSTLSSNYWNDTTYFFHEDTTIVCDAAFRHTGIAINYTVELVHQSGHVDTIEQMRYDPYDSIFISPTTVHIVHADNKPDTVMLRVRANIVGLPADSGVEFAREVMYDSYPSSADTAIAIGSAGVIAPDSTGCLQVLGPYPNPSVASASNVSILLSYCHAGQTVTAAVFDVMGNQIGSAVSITSDGSSWDRVQIPAPANPGTYFIHVSAGILSQTLNYSVTN